MKTNRTYWAEKLRVARNAWATLRPLEKQRGSRAIKVGFDFDSRRTFAPGIKFEAFVQALQLDDDWMIKIRAALFDRGPKALESVVYGHDRTDMYLFDFDVLAAANFLDGKKIPWSPPQFAFDAGDEEIVRHLTTYSRDIDRLWQFAGGYNVEAFRELSKWLMRNQKDVALMSTGGIGPICAALEYGERDLAVRFLRDLEDGWAERRRREQNFDLVRHVYENVENQHARLRGLMDLPPKS